GTKIWDLVAQQERGTLPGVTMAHQATFANDGKTFATWARAGQGGDMKIWDTATSREKVTIAMGKEPIFAAALSGDGQAVVGMTVSGTLKMWNAVTAEEQLSKEMSSRAFHLSLSPNGKVVALAAQDRLKLYDLASGKETPLGVANPGQNSNIVLSPDGQTLASHALWDPAVRLWDVASGRELHPSEGASGFGTSGLITPDGRTIATG